MTPLDFCRESLEVIERHPYKKFGLICQPPRYCSSGLFERLMKMGCQIICDNIDVRDMFDAILMSEHRFKQQMLADLEPLFRLHARKENAVEFHEIISERSMYIRLTEWHAAYLLEYMSKVKVSGPVMYELPFIPLPFNDTFDVLILSEISDTLAYADTPDLDEHVTSEGISSDVEKNLTKRQRAYFEEVREVWKFDLTFSQ